MSLRIALTHAFCWPEVRRGGERYLHELAGALARRGHRVSILAGAEHSSRTVEEGVRVLRLARGSASDARAPETFARRVVRRLALERYDVVHSLGPRDAVASLKARVLHRSRRTVYTNLGNPVRAWWVTLPENEHHERVVREIDVYGCLSRHALRCLESDYGRQGELTPGGVRLQTFAPVRPREQVPTLLYAGALEEPRKGIDILLRALPQIAKREPRVRLWLSGSGDPARLLADAPAESRERTALLPRGSPHDLAERYAGAWATVLPSIDEAFGLALVESLACGTPIVGCDHAGIPELIRPNVGALAQPHDPHALAEACLVALALATETDIVERCREVARVHDWDAAVAPAIERVYLS